MFRHNDSHRQPSLFGVENQLSASKRKKLRNSWGGYFYREVFSQIDEHRFAVLFDAGNGRPNQGVNRLVSAILIQNGRGLTWQKLFEQMEFDMITRMALGLDEINEPIFCVATYANFRNRLLEHYASTGENLLEGLLDSLSEKQRKRLGLRTDVQRSDSFHALSNIVAYNRVQLLVEVLIRVHRILTDAQRQTLAAALEPYVSQPSRKFVYALERDAIPKTVEALADVYCCVERTLKDSCADDPVFQIFQRVLREHFVSAGDNLKPVPDKDIASDSLQSPDDPDATYGRKGHKSFRGQVVNVVETANPDNPVQLVTDVDVAANTTSDAQFVQRGAERWKGKTPDLDEMHTDGNYGSEENDKLLGKLKITHVQTGVKGRCAKVLIKIDEVDEEQQIYEVRCPKQSAVVEPTASRFKASFDGAVCDQCPLADDCPAIVRKNQTRAIYFTRAQALVSMRARRVKSLPKNRQQVRSNVEATVKEFTVGFNHKGKLKVRGAFSTLLYIFSAAIMVNFGRIMRHVSKEHPESTNRSRATSPLVDNCRALISFWHILRRHWSLRWILLNLISLFRSPSWPLAA